MKKSFASVVSVLVLTGVFTPKTSVESVAVQKLAILLGYSWGKAGAKVIPLSAGQGIRFHSDGRMTPVTDAGDDTVTLNDFQQAWVNAKKDLVVTTPGALKQIWNSTKCREIEAGIAEVLSANVGLMDSDELVLPQDLLDRAARELDDNQRKYFADAGIVISHPNDKYKMNMSFGDTATDNLRKVDVQVVAENTKVGSVLVDTEGNVYFVD